MKKTILLLILLSLIFEIRLLLVEENDSNPKNSTNSTPHHSRTDALLKTKLDEQNKLEKFNLAHIICERKTGVKFDDINQERILFKRISHAEKCYLTCFFTQIGLVDEDPKKDLIVEATFENWGIRTRDFKRFESIIADCNKTINTKRMKGNCEIGPAIFICLDIIFHKKINDFRTGAGLMTTQ